jgi:hypothetical protein
MDIVAAAKDYFRKESSGVFDTKEALYGLCGTQSVSEVRVGKDQDRKRFGKGEDWMTENSPWTIGV